MKAGSFRERFWTELLGRNDVEEPAPPFDYEAYSFRDRFWFELLGTPLPLDPATQTSRSERAKQVQVGRPWLWSSGGPWFLGAAAVVVVAAVVGFGIADSRTASWFSSAGAVVVALGAVAQFVVAGVWSVRRTKDLTSRHGTDPTKADIGSPSVENSSDSQTHSQPSLVTGVGAPDEQDVAAQVLTDLLEEELQSEDSESARPAVEDSAPPEGVGEHSWWGHPLIDVPPDLRDRVIGDSYSMTPTEMAVYAMRVATRVLPQMWPRDASTPAIPVDAEDIAQDAMFRLVSRIPLERRPSHLTRAYIVRQVRWEVAESHRKYFAANKRPDKRQYVVEPASDDATYVDREIDTVLLRDALQRGLEQLNNDDVRAVLQATFVLDEAGFDVRPTPEVAALLLKSVGEVKRLRASGVSQLRAILFRGE
ncbi:RNA polymerase sigma factor [Nocardia salmonicida]|uniref:RNA polymerase sigma factor n=1 Tax=Nocardia salmonicida TaxID=53431 RepID=UPI0037BB2A55